VADKHASQQQLIPAKHASQQQLIPAKHASQQQLIPAKHASQQQLIPAKHASQQQLRARWGRREGRARDQRLREKGKMNRTAVVLIFEKLEGASLDE
jgi:hypothetical protein